MSPTSCMSFLASSPVPSSAGVNDEGWSRSSGTRPGLAATPGWTGYSKLSPAASTRWPAPLVRKAKNFCAADLCCGRLQDRGSRDVLEIAHVVRCEVGDPGIDRALPQLGLEPVEVVVVDDGQVRGALAHVTDDGLVVGDGGAVPGVGLQASEPRQCGRFAVDAGDRAHEGPEVGLRRERSRSCPSTWDRPARAPRWAAATR